MKKTILTAIATLFVTSLVLSQSTLLTDQGSEITKFALGGSGLLLLSIGAKTAIEWLNVGFEVDLKGVNL